MGDRLQLIQPPGQAGTPRCESDLRSRPPGHLGVGWGRFVRTLLSVEDIPSRWNHNAQARVGSCVWNVLSRGPRPRRLALPEHRSSFYSGLMQ